MGFGDNTKISIDMQLPIDEDQDLITFKNQKLTFTQAEVNLVN